MKDLSFTSVVALAREVGRAFVGIAAAIIGALMRMPLPRLLAVCVVVALIAVVLPLAVTLFVVALIVKLAVAAVVLASRRETPRQLEHHGEEG